MALIASSTFAAVLYVSSMSETTIELAHPCAEVWFHRLLSYKRRKVTM